MTFASLRSKSFLLVLPICLTLLLAIAVLSFALLPSHARAAGNTTVTSNVTKMVKITTVKGVFAFRPKTLKIHVGTTVVWTNTTQAPHTVTSDTGVFDSGVISPGGTFSFTFMQTGTFAYHCNIHPFMKATVIVS